MNARLLAAFLCLTAASTGCVIVDNNSGNPGDVTLAWTFGPDGRCVDVPSVKSIKVTIPGEQLDSNGFYACNTAGSDGITLHNFRAGTYSYTVDALDAFGDVVYKASGSFTVNGNVLERVDLTPNGKPYAYVSWSFPPTSTTTNPSCAQAGVTAIKVSIDNGPWENLDCTAGMTNGGVPSPYLDPGNHTINLVAYGEDDYGRQNVPLYTTQGTMTLPRAGSIAVSYKFFTVGGMSLRWELWDPFAGSSGSYKSCSEAGVTGVRINLQAEDGSFVYGTDGDPHACTGAPIVYQFLKPGRYKVYIRGYSGQSLTYTNESSTPTTLTVRSFDSRTQSDTATTIDIIRK